MFERINQQKELISCINEVTEKILSFLIGDRIREEKTSNSDKIDCLLSRTDDNTHTLEEILTTVRQISEILLEGTK